MYKYVEHSELLSPAGSFEKLKTAFLYGADTVYFGTPDMSLRVKSTFSLEEAIEGVKFARKNGKRAYLTLNLFAHNKDILKLENYIKHIKVIKPHGVIIADPGIFQYVKINAPELKLHISTQANTCSWTSVKFWQSLGANLCVLSRELSFKELIEIRKKCPDMKLETFIHGAMCMAYSGRCMLSNYLIDRGANQGSCANSCRWNYKIHMKIKDGSTHEIALTEANKELFDFFMEEKYRPGELIHIEENIRGSYLLNAKDLCLMPKLNDYLAIGIDSLKLEGRNKSSYYVGLVTRAYRYAIDEWYRNAEKWNYRKYMRELETLPNRGYTLGFHEGQLSNYTHSFCNPHSLAEWEFSGVIENVKDDAFYILVKNKLQAGDILEFIPPRSWKTILLRLYEFEVPETGKRLTVVQPGQTTTIRIAFTQFKYEDPAWLKKHLPPLSIIRSEKSMTELEWTRLKHDKTAFKIELGANLNHIYQRQKNTIEDLSQQDNSQKRLKTPRIGTKGCCGKGCNGCLIFTYEPAFAQARLILSRRKQGILLTKQESRKFCK